MHRCNECKKLHRIFPNRSQIFLKVLVQSLPLFNISTAILLLCFFTLASFVSSPRVLSTLSELMFIQSVIASPFDHYYTVYDFCLSSRLHVQCIQNDACCICIKDGSSTFVVLFTKSCYDSCIFIWFTSKQFVVNTVTVQFYPDLSVPSLYATKFQISFP